MVGVYPVSFVFFGFSTSGSSLSPQVFSTLDPRHRVYVARKRLERRGDSLRESRHQHVHYCHLSQWLENANIFGLVETRHTHHTVETLLDATFEDDTDVAGRKVMSLYSPPSLSPWPWTTASLALSCHDAQDTMACVVSALVMDFATAETRQPQCPPRLRLVGTLESQKQTRAVYRHRKSNAAQHALAPTADPGLVQQMDRSSWIGTAVRRGRSGVTRLCSPCRSGLTGRGSTTQTSLVATYFERFLVGLFLLFSSGLSRRGGPSFLAGVPGVFCVCAGVACCVCPVRVLLVCGACVPWCGVGPVLALLWSSSGPVFLVVRASGVSLFGFFLQDTQRVFKGWISIQRLRDGSPSDRAGKSGSTRQSWFAESR